jgi:hypothetical protein
MFKTPTNAYGKAVDSIREVFTMGGPGVHVDIPATVVAGLARITGGRLRIWKVKQ